MLPEATLFFHAPRFVYGARYGSEEAEGRPNQRQTSGDPRLKTLGTKRVELIGHEVEASWKVAKNEPQNARPIALIGRDDTENRNEQQKERKQREKSVVSDGCCVREIVSVEQPYDGSPGGLTAQA
jgi:hypothetical protein